MSTPSYNCLIIAKTNLNNLPNKLIKIFRMRKIPVIFADLTKIMGQNKICYSIIYEKGVLNNEL